MTTKTVAKCSAHLTGAGLWNIGNFCRKPAVGEFDGQPRCKYHLGVEARREAKRNAPHVHSFWTSTARRLADGSFINFCASCGAPTTDA